MCMCVPVWAYVHMRVQVPMESSRGHRIPKVGVTGGGELPSVGSGMELLSPLSSVFIETFEKLLRIFKEGLES